MYLLEPFEWPKGSQASCGVLRGNSGLLSRPCRKRMASTCDNGGFSWFFSSCGGKFGVSLELRRGTQGASRVSPGKSSLHLSCEGERGIDLDSRQGNRASICVEGEISRSFSSCGRKLCVPAICDGDLRELLICPMGSQESVRVVRGPSGFFWGRCNGRGPYLEMKLEPQGCSPILMWISGSVCSFRQGVRFRPVWRQGTLLSY